MEHGIAIVPLTIRFGNEEFIDMVELSPEEFWERCKRSSTLPETAAPSIGAFSDVFHKAVSEGHDGVVCITLSSQLSATHQSALAAAEQMSVDFEVRVIDSRLATMGVGMLALQASELAQSGASLQAITDYVLKAREYTYVVGMVDSLEYLRKGGRIGGAQAMLGTMLSMKPIIGIKDGVVEGRARQRTRSRALSYLMDLLRAENKVTSLAITHAMMDNVNEFIDQLKEVFPTVPISVGYLGPVIGAHTGPGTLGITYQTPPSTGEPS
jgi:DegV family protein with EDD domain